MSEKATLVQKRGRVKGTLTRLKAFADSITDRTDEEDIKVRLVRLEDAWNEFQDIEDELLLVDGQASEMEEYEGKYFEIKGALNRAIRARSQGQERRAGTLAQDTIHSTLDQSALDRSQLQLLNLRLPKFNIPHFSGDYKEWPSFKDLYEASIHDNENLSGSQKFQYLKGLLKGNAASVVRHLNVTDANYVQAWEKLTERFDKTFHITNSYIKTFIDQASLNQPSARGLRSITDTFDEVIRGLKGLGKDAEKRDAWLIYIGTSKLDYETRELWSQEISDKDFPSFEDFLAFLNKRCNSLEACGLMSKRQNQSVKSMHVSTASKQNICLKCGSNHPLHQCETFKRDPTVSRREFVVLKSLCFKCLGTNHSVRACRSKMKCNQCNGSHHPLLHETTFKHKPTESAHTSESSRDDHSELTNSISKFSPSSNSRVVSPSTNPSSGYSNTIKPSTIHLTTAKVPEIVISSPDSRSSLREGQPSSLVNTCVKTQKSTNHFEFPKSTVSLLPTALVQVLDKQEKLVLCRILLDSGSQISLVSDACAQRLNLRRENARLSVTGISAVEGRRWPKGPSICDESTYVVNSIPPTVGLEFFEGLQLADPHFHKPSEIDIIIGADYFFDVIKEGKLYDRSGHLIGQETIFGWVAIGTCSLLSSPVNNLHLQVLEDLDKTLRRFWEVEEVAPRSESVTPEEKECETHFSDTTTRHENRYVVSLPFKSDVGDFGNSLTHAVKRFHSMEKMFQRDAIFKEQYVNFMQEYENLGHMEIIPDDQVPIDDRSCFYLPHHAVFQSTPQPKIRVVFDGSCRSTTGISLNDKLMVGPTIQRDLIGILLNFRKYKVAFCADVEKMYRQVLIAPSDKDFQRIVWRENPNLPLRHYRLLTVTYGTASAPFLATRVLQQIADDFEKVHPLVTSIIRKCFYIDDLLSGADSLSDALTLKENLTDMLGSRGFNLTKWLSNLTEFTSNDDVNTAAEDLMTIDENVLTSKVLGIQWDSKRDVFLFKVSLSDSPEMTKRQILSESSKIFDPMGWLSPVVISVKVLLQRLWLCKYGWDDVLPKEILQRWKTIKEQLPVISTIQIPRCIFADKVRIQFHGFCDASELSYAAVVYCRSFDREGNVYVRLVAAKTKVAPLKQVSIPRLELCGAFLLAQLMQKVKDSLELKNFETYAWTDSTVVLAWLSDIPRKWKTYIANRTSEILRVIPRAQWSHVPSKQNPADPASRGVLPAEAVNLGIIERIVQNLTAWEINQAEILCLRTVQQTSFADEMKSLKSQRAVPSRSVLSSLCPFVDTNGIIRVGGRLRNADFDFNTKHPIIVPKRHPISLALIAELHKIHLHPGPSTLMGIIRQRFWILGMRNLVKKVSLQCIICFRQRAARGSQLMAHLPEARVKITRPFFNVGIDYGGPVKLCARIGRGMRPVKGYFAVFICLTTRAVHIESVTDLTAEAFVATLRRFIARRGIPGNIFCDNATNFVGEKGQIADMHNLALSINENTLMSSFLSQNRIQWNFIPPSAPHFGGIWEAAVKSSKWHLRRVIGESILSFEEFSTLLAQIEAILNSRPYSPLSSNADDFEALTPAHFLIGEPLTSLPERDYSEAKVSRLGRWQHIQSMVQGFWKRWKNEYLTTLQTRPKWRKEQVSLKPGELVLIGDDNIPPCRWLLGRILETHPGKDNLVRVVTVKTRNGTCKRAVTKLYKLPISQATS